jgi:hypothetical protein
VDQVSIFIAPVSVSDLRIDGRYAGKRKTPFFMYLPPGKHTLTFSYWEDRRMEANNGTYLGNLTIDFPNNTKELVMEPGKQYGIYAIAGNVSRAGGWGNTASATLMVGEWPTRMGDFRSYTPPALRETTSNYKYLEPYDTSIPLNQQAFLEVRNDIYIVGFNGETVSWGWNDNYNVTIGIPAGRHALQLVKDKNHYAMTIDCLTGSRYVFWFSDSEETIIASNITGSPGPGATRATEATGILSLTDIPSQYNGKYVCFIGKLSKKDNLLGYTSGTGQSITLVQIKDGKVEVPLRIVVKKELQGYYGNDTVSSGMVGIFNTRTVALSALDELDDLIAAITFPSITFTNGNAAKSAKDGTLLSD